MTYYLDREWLTNACWKHYHQNYWLSVIPGKRGFEQEDASGRSPPRWMGIEKEDHSERVMGLEVSPGVEKNITLTDQNAQRKGIEKKQKRIRERRNNNNK